MIRCLDVTKSYTVGDRKVQALRGVTLEIPTPGFFAIMGQSGSGKSTLLHLLAALDRPDSGELFIGDKPVHQLTDKQATLFRRRELGIVFQQFNLIPTLTARENVELPGVLAGEDAKWVAERSTELMTDLGVIDRAHHRPEALSGGEQQRVAIARALLFSPRVLLADEPTGNLDSASSQKLWGLLGRVAQSHETTVVMVTHEPAAAAHCQSIFVIRDGRMTTIINTEGLDAAGVAARYQECLSAS